MSRHNRRRTRGGRKHSTPRSTSADSNIDNFDGTATGTVLVPAFARAPLVPQGFAAVQDAMPRVPATPQRAPLNGRGATVSARVWHNRYLAWQNRDRKQREELARLDAQKAKIFGCSTWSDDEDEGSGDDDDQDEDGLEEKMLEYFGGLEWLDT